MILTFDKAKVMELMRFEHAGKSSPKPYTGEGWGCKAVKSHGLVLVGDQGVYLLANRKQEKAPSKSGLIAYAKESDPTNKRLEFDEWYGAKRASFGGDDGCEFLTARSVLAWLNANRDSKVLRMDLTPRGYVLLGGS